MKLKFYLLLVGLFTFSQMIFAQADSLETEKPEIEYLCGTVERNVLQTEGFNHAGEGVFFEEYSNYKPEQDVLNKLNKDLFSYSITIVLGTWCHDSHEQVPRMYKVLDKMDYNTSLVQLICVDKDKTGCDTDISDLNIERVPTFIFYKEGKETGRIIETPEFSLETDLLNILSY